MYKYLDYKDKYYDIYYHIYHTVHYSMHSAMIPYSTVYTESALISCCTGCRTATVQYQTAVHATVSYRTRVQSNPQTSRHPTRRTFAHSRSTSGQTSMCPTRTGWTPPTRTGWVPRRWAGCLWAASRFA